MDVTRRLIAVAGALLLGALGATPVLADGRSFTDAAGRTVALPERVERVFAAGPPASVLVYTLAPQKMAGWVRAPSAAEKAFIAPPYRDLPETGRLTGRGNTANLEAVLAARPDLVIDVGTVDATYASLADKVQQQTGIPVVLLDGAFLKTPETYRQLGDLLGTRERAEILARYADETINGLKPRLDAVPAGERPKVYFGRGKDGLETGLAGSINVELLGIVGATNVAAAAGKGGLATVSREQVLGWNPDVVIAASADFAGALASDPTWKDLAAVRANKVFVPPSLPFGWFDSPPGVNRLIGVRWLAAILYPKAFPEDLTATTRDFYRLFYGVEPSDSDLARLLAGATPK